MCIDTWRQADAKYRRKLACRAARAEAAGQAKELSPSNSANCAAGEAAHEKAGPSKNLLRRNIKVALTLVKRPS